MTKEDAEAELALWDAMIAKGKELIAATGADPPDSDEGILLMSFGICGALGRKGPGSQPAELAHHAEYIAKLRAGDLNAVCGCGRKHMGN